MTPRRSVWVLCLAGLALLAVLLAAPAVYAGGPPIAEAGPIGGGEVGPGNEPPGGGMGDGGDPDEFFLVEPPDHEPSIVADEESLLSGEKAAKTSLWQFRVWLLTFLYWTGVIH